MADQRQITGRPAAIIGRPIEITGRPAAIIGRPIEITGRPAAIIGRPIEIIGIPVANQRKTSSKGRPVAKEDQ